MLTASVTLDQFVGMLKRVKANLLMTMEKSASNAALWLKSF
jgi:hypothetical protein